MLKNNVEDIILFQTFSPFAWNSTRPIPRSPFLPRRQTFAPFACFPLCVLCLKIPRSIFHEAHFPKPIPRRQTFAPFACFPSSRPLREIPRSIFHEAHSLKPIPRRQTFAPFACFPSSRPLREIPRSPFPQTHSSTTNLCALCVNTPTTTKKGLT